jgi:hypothetical protein
MASMRPRLHSILNRYGDALMAALRLREPDSVIGETAESLVLRFAKADPSVNKSATQWLIQTFLAHGFLLEDLGKAHSTLTLFRRTRHRLPVEQRDLRYYSTLADVWKAVGTFAAPELAPEGRAARRAERAAVRAESRILIERADGFTVAVPLTQRAAIWWGRGTRWCTAATQDNASMSHRKFTQNIDFVRIIRRKPSPVC